MSFVKKYTAVYGNNQSYLLYSLNYPSPNLSDFSLRAFYADLFTGAASLVKMAFSNFISSVDQIVNAGTNTVINGIDQAGNYIGSLSANINSSGQWIVSTFSAANPRMVAAPFQKPAVRNIYYSTRVLHKLQANKITTMTQVATTMIAVSNDMKISFIPSGQTASIDSVNTPFKIKMLIDTTKLSTNGFSLADESRIKLYRYDDPSNSWILEGGIFSSDTVAAMVTHMSNYILGIELTNVTDTTAPDIYDYGPKQKTLTQDSMIYAKIKDNQYGVGVDWTKTFIVANKDTLNSSFDPANQMIFYNLSSKDNLSGNINITVYTSDYNGNTSSVQFGFVLTSVSEKNIPTKFYLSQNYPNPFNPTTKVDFSLAKESDAGISVYNSIGQYVTTLVEKRLASGNYTVDLDGSRLSSGIYFYSFSAKPTDGSPEYRETKKMVMVK